MGRGRGTILGFWELQNPLKKIQGAERREFFFFFGGGGF